MGADNPTSKRINSTSQHENGKTTKPQLSIFHKTPLQAATSPLHFPFLRRGAGTHGDVLNVHHGAF